MAVDYNKFKGKPFQVISKLGVRYTGIFDHIDQANQTICLYEVFNHGTEDRPTVRHLAGSPVTLGWVRFHTDSIESLALVENYIPPSGDVPADPILASVSQTAPPSSTSSANPAPRTQASAPSAPAATTSAQSKPPIDLSIPRRPSEATVSASKALDRVQQSLSELAVNSQSPAGGSSTNGYAGPSGARSNGGRRYQQPPQPPAVPDAEFDFSKGNEEFEKQREAMKRTKSGDSVVESEESESEGEDDNVPAKPPHPAAIVHSTSVGSNGNDTSAPGAGVKKAVPAYSKSSFFDNISTDSTRVSRSDERFRNLDTFGEAGMENGGPGGRGGYGFGGRGGAGGGRGGFGAGAGRGGYGGGGYVRGGFGGGEGMRGRGRGFGGVGGGYRGRGGAPAWQ